MKANTDDLHRINDVLSALAAELGVPVTTEWEDAVLNDLTHAVHEAFVKQVASNDPAPVISDSIRFKVTKTLTAIANLMPGAYMATRGRNYSELPEDAKVLARLISTRYQQKFALMFLALHGLDSGILSWSNSLDLTGGMANTVVVPDFSEYSEEDMTEFLNLMVRLGVISLECRDEVLNAE